MKQQRAKRAELHVVRGNGGKVEEPELEEGEKDSDVRAEAGENGRGVYEYSGQLPGIRLFHIVDHFGDCIRVVQEPEQRVTRKSVGDLWLWLEAEDPIDAPPAVRLL